MIDNCLRDKLANRRAFTLVEALVVAAILLTLVGLLWPAISAVASRSQDGVEAVAVEPVRSLSLLTRTHDGHWWVTNANAGHFVHHPECPCVSRKAEEER